MSDTIYADELKKYVDSNDFMKDFEPYGSQVEFGLGNSAWDYGEDEPSFAWFVCSIKDFNVEKMEEEGIGEQDISHHWKACVDEILESYAKENGLIIKPTFGKTDYEYNRANDRMEFSQLVYFN